MDKKNTVYKGRGGGEKSRTVETGLTPREKCIRDDGRKLPRARKVKKVNRQLFHFPTTSYVMAAADAAAATKSI